MSFDLSDRRRRSCQVTRCAATLLPTTGCATGLRRSPPPPPLRSDPDDRTGRSCSSSLRSSPSPPGRCTRRIRSYAPTKFRGSDLTFGQYFSFTNPYLNTNLTINSQRKYVRVVNIHTQGMQWSTALFYFF